MRNWTDELQRAALLSVQCSPARPGRGCWLGWLVLRENGARLTPTETIRLIRDGEKGVWMVGKREIIYLSLHCHHQNVIGWYSVKTEPG